MYVGFQGTSIFILPRHSEGKTHGEPQGWAFLGPAQVTSLVEVRSPRTFGRGGGDCGDREARGPGQRVAGGAPRPLRRQSGSRASGERSPGGEGRTTPAEAAPGPAPAWGGLGPGNLGRRGRRPGTLLPLRPHGRGSCGSDACRVVASQCPPPAPLPRPSRPLPRPRPAP